MLRREEPAVARGADATTFSVYRIADGFAYAVASSLRTPLQSQELAGSVPEQEASEVPQPDQAEVANNARLKLLARKYGRGSISPEETARLDIVTERVNLLIPRVTAADFEAVERVFRDLQEIRNASDDIERDAG